MLCAYFLLIALRKDRPIPHKNEVISFGAPYYRIFRPADEPSDDPLGEKNLQLEIESLTQQMS